MLEEAVLLVLGPVAVLVVFALLLAQLHERRVKKLREAADEMGFSFQVHDAVLTGDLFGQDGSIRLENVLRGQAQGLEVALFDCLRTVRVGQYLRHSRVSLMMFRDREANWPLFSLRPRQSLDYFSGLFRRGKMLFPSDIAFSRPNVLEAEDEEAVTEMFTEEVRSYFAKHPGWYLQAKKETLLFTRGKLLAAGQLRAYLESGFEVLNLLQTGNPQG
jgi:hypothetical protein